MADYEYMKRIRNYLKIMNSLDESLIIAVRFKCDQLLIDNYIHNESSGTLSLKRKLVDEFTFQT